MGTLPSFNTFGTGSEAKFRKPVVWDAWTAFLQAPSHTGVGSQQPRFFLCPCSSGQEQVLHLSCSNKNNLSWDLVGTGISKLMLKSLCLAGEPSSRERLSWLPRKEEVNQYSDERVTQRKHVLDFQVPSSLKPGCIFPSVAMAPCSLLIVSVLLHLDRCGSCNCKQSYEWMRSPPPRGGPDFSLPQMLVANP